MRGMLTLISVLAAHQAGAQTERTTLCSVARLCVAEKGCGPSDLQFELGIHSRGAMAVRLQGSVRIAEEGWKSVAPFWFVRRPNPNILETLHLSYDQHFVWTQIHAANVEFRLSKDLLQLGGRTRLKGARIQTMVGECIE